MLAFYQNKYKREVYTQFGLGGGSGCNNESKNDIKMSRNYSEYIGIVDGKKCEVVNGILRIGKEEFHRLTYKELLRIVNTLKSPKWKKNCLFGIKSDKEEDDNLKCIYKYMLRI